VNKLYSKLSDFDFTDKRVLVRVDFNVPIKNFQITDDSRIRKALPTIKYIIKKKPKQIILCSHLGRPKGEYTPEFSLKPVADRVQELLGLKIFFDNNPHIMNISEFSDNKIVVLENLRFDKFEKENDEDFAKKLASFADVFVLDAFGTAHRSHASVVGVQKILPSCAGLLLEKEIKFLSEEMNNPKKPFVAIISGAKSDKINVLNTLLNKVDTLIIGGVLANTFLKAKGKDIGLSKYDPDSIEYAKQVLQKYKDKIALPVDFVMGTEFSSSTKTRIAGLDEDLTGWMIMDIGPYTISGYKKILDKAKTVVFAGPVGVYEFDNFSRGTWDIANYISELKATTIIGGGDTGDAINKFNLTDKMTHVSTGGGASLELLADHNLPGIDALEENYNNFKRNQ
jgi:3-phosphoglycerate kinase